MSAPRVIDVPEFVPNLDPRLFSDDHIPELVRELVQRVAWDNEYPTGRASS